MNTALLEARKKFRGQKIEMKGTSFSNDPLPEGKYITEVVDSKIQVNESDGRPKHYMMLKIVGGDTAGRNLWPFPPYLDSEDGVTQSAQYVKTIRGGEVVPHEMRDGAYLLNPSDYLEQAEELIHSLIGEMVEVTVRNRKARPDNKHLNQETGLPYQSTYINRGLGEDKAGMENTKEETIVKKTERSSMAVSPSRKKKKIK